MGETPPPPLPSPTLKEQIRFEVDILADDKVDLDIKLPLTENVVVARDDQGNETPSAVDEPLPAWMS